VLLFIVAFGPSETFSAITFTDGKWETSFGSTAVDQIDAGWQNGSGLPDGLVKWGDPFMREAFLSDGSGDYWTVSGGNPNEWYYNSNLAALRVDSAYGPQNLTVGGVVQRYLNFQNGVIGSLTAGQRGWGDVDGIGYNTVYIYSTVDPDSLSGKTIAWISHDGPENYISGDIYSQIFASANNPAGSGGNGYRHKQGDGHSQGTGSLIVQFPAKEKEIWVRWYMRWEDGFAWSSMDVDKSIYLYTGYEADKMGYEFEARSYSNYSLLAQGTSDYYQVNTDTYGFQQINGGIVGNNTWHCFEVQIKLDTDQTDGIGRIWIDGVLKAENTSVDWSNGVASRKEGISYFAFESNQAWVQNSRPVYVDYDDMVVYNTTPPGRDSSPNNNPFIGPLDYTPTGVQPTTSTYKNILLKQIEIR